MSFLRAHLIGFIFLALLTILGAESAQASHFRGGFISASIDAAGVVTVNAESLWRNAFVSSVSSVQVLDVNRVVKGTITLTKVGLNDTSDPSFTRVIEQGTGDLATMGALSAALPAGTYILYRAKCCRVLGLANVLNNSFSFETVVHFNGAANSSPSINSSVVTGVAKGFDYSQNLNAIDPDGGPLSYQLITNSLTPDYGPTSQVPGMTIDSTGQVFIPASSTSTLQSTNASNPAGDYVFKVRITDASGSHTDRDVMLDVVTGSNTNPPVLVAIGNRTVSVGSSLTFPVSASDADTVNIVTLSASPLPGSATFTQTPGNPASGTFSFTPVSADVGAHNINFNARDNGVPNLVNSQLVSITVTGSNHPPVLNPVGNQSTQTGVQLSFSINGSDPDAGDALIYSASFLPAGATFDPVTRVFSWIPAVQGITTGVVFQVTDNGVPNLSAQETISISVGAVNHAPVLTGVGDRGARPGVSLSFVVGAIDVDAGDAVTLSLGTGGLPPGAAFDAATGLFQWMPTASQLGMWTVNFKATDNGTPALNDIQTVRIGVGNYPDALTGTDPNQSDTDSDGLNDNVETDSGVFVSATDTGTDPVRPDTDSDGFSDGNEVASGTNPLSAATPAGTTHVWMGTTSTVWNVASNWDVGTMPTTASHVFIPASPANQPILSTATSIAGLDNQAGSILALRANFSIANGFTNNGTIDFNTTRSSLTVTTGTLTNTGTIINHVGAGINANITNTGTITVLQDMTIDHFGVLTIDLTTGGTTLDLTAGTVNVAAGVILSCGTGSTTLIDAVGSKWTGAGKVWFDVSTTVTLTGNVVHPAGIGGTIFDFDTTTINGTGTLTNNGAMNSMNTTFTTTLVNHGVLGGLGGSDVQGLFASSPGSSIINGGLTLSADVNMDGVTVDNTRIVINTTAPMIFDNITFQNYAPTTTPLMLNISNTTQTFNNLNFSSPLTTGFHIGGIGTGNTITIGSTNLTSATRRVTTAMVAQIIWPDTTPPTITLLGSNPLIVAQNSTYTDTGATAQDTRDGTITANIVTVNQVNTAVAGNYTVTYNVKDAAGNPATPVTRTVQVMAPPTAWRWAHPTPMNDNFHGVAYNGTNTYVAVGNGGVVFSSSDGITWTQRSSATTNRLREIGWGGGLFVAVGNVGTIVTSPDGITWTSRASGTTLILDDVVWNGSMFVVVGDSGTVISSADGVTWSSIQVIAGQISITANLSGVTWGLSQFIAVGTLGTILTSPNGSTWTVQTSNTTSTLDGIAWNGTTFVVGGGGGTIVTSLNGVLWGSPVSTPITNWIEDITWDGAQFVAVGGSSTNSTIWSSPAGSIWTAQASVQTVWTTAVTSNGVIGNGKLIVAVGFDGGIMTSLDGVNWISRLSSLTTHTLDHIAWNGVKFVTMGKVGATMISPDGLVWTLQTPPTTNNIEDVIWAGGQFVAVGQSGTILTSPDGITWATQNSTSINWLESIVWNGLQFVAVGLQGTILTSADSITWVAQTSNTFNSLRGLAWSGTQFVAVGSSGGTLVTSPDGVNWTLQSPITTTWLADVLWNGSQFVAIGSLGEIWTSTDGVGWVRRISGTTMSLDGIAWGGAYFVITGSGGTILTSPDGITWSAQASGTSSRILSGAGWNGTRFVVTGSSGTILTSP